jgi:multiple sugar transport system permease protein
MMTSRAKTVSQPWVLSHRMRVFTSVAGVSFVALAVLIIFLMPAGYMIVTAFKTSTQIGDPNAGLLPASPITFQYNGQDYPLYEVPTDTGTHQMALIKHVKIGSDYTATFIDPSNVAAGPIVKKLNWFLLTPVYRFSPTLDNFPGSWNQINLGLLFRNTIIIAILGTIGALCSGVCVAYGFSRFRIPGIDKLFIVLIATIILPTQITLIPQYIFFRQIGWGGTWLPLIIPHFFANAYNVFLLRQYFKGIPKELDEAASIDGASPLQILLYVILPQSIPVLTAVSLFHFFFSWNDFFAPLIYLQGKPELYTISIGMTQFNNIFQAQPGFAMAAALMSISVPLLMFFLAQRVFMQGIVITGIEK